MARVQTIVQLSDELVTQLDELAAAEGTSRSAVIRTAIVDHLAALRSADVGRRIVDGYRAHPQATPDAWGAPDSSGTSAATELWQRLDVEEATHGAAPW